VRYYFAALQAGVIFTGPGYTGDPKGFDGWGGDLNGFLGGGGEPIDYAQLHGHFINAFLPEFPFGLTQLWVGTDGGFGGGAGGGNVHRDPVNTQFDRNGGFGGGGGSGYWWMVIPIQTGHRIISIQRTITVVGAEATAERGPTPAVPVPAAAAGSAPAEPFSFKRAARSRLAGSLSIAGGNAVGGAGGHWYGFSGGQILSEDGAGLGSGIFLQGNQTLTFAPAAGVVLTISDSIFDQNGYDRGTGNTAHLVLNGAGTLALGGHNGFGGMTIKGGTLALTYSDSAGYGDIAFAPGRTRRSTLPAAPPRRTRFPDLTRSSVLTFRASTAAPPPRSQMTCLSSPRVA